MRFIFNFFLFGMLFYLIHMFFPDAFQSMVNGADQVYLFGKDLIQMVSDAVSGSGNQPAQP